jgi:hypothetical protein
VSGRARAVSAARKERGAPKGPSAVLTCGCVARESKKTPRQERGGRRGGLFCESVTPRFGRFAPPDAPSKRRFHPPVHNFFARVNRRPASAPASFWRRRVLRLRACQARPSIFCIHVRSGDFIGISRISNEEARKFLELRNDCAPRDAGECSRRRIMLWAAALTHKIKWSHYYFFPAVVIGL